VSSIEVNGGNVVYEVLGESGDLIALTPGGRFSKEIPGLRPLAEALVAGCFGTGRIAALPTSNSTGRASLTCVPRR
jgi:hypothetical protein